MRVLLTILTTTLLFNAVYSQAQYKGRLISGLTGKPISSGDIEFNEKILATTDSLGYFTIELDSSKNISLLFFSPTVRWVAVDSLKFVPNGITIIRLFPECLYSAEKDIQENKIKLFYPSGPFSPLLTKADRRFEKKYKIFYFGDGDCTEWIPTDCIETYNHKIGIYLDKKYGTKWRKEVGKKAYGL